MITLTVMLQVREGHLDPFLDAITENALRSFTDEPGCLRFDVSQLADDPHRFVFYEIYSSSQALAAHRAAPHFATWRLAAEQHVVPGSQVNTVAELRIAHAVPSTPAIERSTAHPTDRSTEHATQQEGPA